MEIGNEVIELLDSNGKPVDVSNEEHLPKESILTEASSTDENIELLVEDGQLIEVVGMIKEPWCRNCL